MESLMSYIEGHPAGQFKPVPHYSPEGDSLTFYFRDDESFAERIDDFLTVYKSIDSNELVGCQVKGLPAALKLLGDFGLHFWQGEKLKLSLLFMAIGFEASDKHLDCYKKLGKIASENDLEIEPPSSMLQEDASLTV
jgi:hypothetical protein